MGIWCFRHIRPKCETRFRRKTNKGGRLIYCGVGTSGRLGILEACEYRPKTAIVMVLCGVGADRAKEMLGKVYGRIAKVLEK